MLFNYRQMDYECQVILMEKGQGFLPPDL
jgi:hypothetical protein